MATDNDVLLYRRGGARYHPGKQYWDQLLSGSVERYMNANRLKDKRSIAREIVLQVQATGGRLLYIMKYLGLELT